MNVTKTATNILNKLYYEGRNGIKTKNNFPDKLKLEIKETVKENFKGQINFKGARPYYTFANILGIKNRINTQDEDGVIFCVGSPGAGKSSLAITLARFSDPTISEGRIIFDMAQLKKFFNRCATELKKEKAERLEGREYTAWLKGKAIVLDEGVFMMFSGDAMTKHGKEIQKLFSVVRALNLMVFVCATNFKKINRGVKEDRIISLIRLPKRGLLQFYSKKGIRRIKINDFSIDWGTANFVEQCGYIEHKSPLWQNYEYKKADFLFSATE